MIKGYDISLMTSWSCLVISTQLTEYLENNNLLNESQYAYRNNSSTEQALVNVKEQIQIY